VNFCHCFFLGFLDSSFFLVIKKGIQFAGRFSFLKRGEIENEAITFFKKRKGTTEIIKKFDEGMNQGSNSHESLVE